MKPEDSPKLEVKRKRNKITGDPSRVITRLHLPHEKHRITNIITRILSLPETDANTLHAKIHTEFADRHQDIGHIFEQHFKAVKDYLPQNGTFSKVQEALIGAYFTKEYAIEAAALFNPSIVAHPDQTHLKEGSLRFIMSLRATGEGHMSSIVFRSGVLDHNNHLLFDPISEFVKTHDLRINPIYINSLFRIKLSEMNANNNISSYILDQLPHHFSHKMLLDQINKLKKAPHYLEALQDKTFEIICLLAESDYVMSFDPDHRISERVIFPTSKNESFGIEDARFVKFTDDQQEATYYATYTAFDRKAILPKFVETKDFTTFEVHTLTGKSVSNKGMALFPRKINGKYVMLSRQDGESNHIMFSNNIYCWENPQIIQEPEQPWEFIQIGNCGSPLETSDGWLVLTHGVGPMRQYCIGAMLLDLENPAKVIARLDVPLLSPSRDEREGYVPNVVYSCGSIIHNGELVIPYAMSDVNSGIATVVVSKLLNSMRTVN